MDIRSGVIIFGVYIFQAGWMDGGVEGGSFFFSFSSQNGNRKGRRNDGIMSQHDHTVTW